MRTRVLKGDVGPGIPETRLEIKMTSSKKVTTLYLGYLRSGSFLRIGYDHLGPIVLGS